MAQNQRRHPYTIEFKLNVMDFMKEQDYDLVEL